MFKALIRGGLVLSMSAGIPTAFLVPSFVGAQDVPQTAEVQCLRDFSTNESAQLHPFSRPTRHLCSSLVRFSVGESGWTDRVATCRIARGKSDCMASLPLPTADSKMLFIRPNYEITAREMAQGCVYADGYPSGKVIGDDGPPIGTTPSTGLQGIVIHRYLCRSLSPR